MGDWTVDGNLSVNDNYLMDVGGGINTPTTTDIIADADAQENYTIKIYRCAYTSYTGTLPSGFQYGFFLVFKRSIGSQIPNGGTIVAFNYESRIAICSNTYGAWGSWSVIEQHGGLVTETKQSGSVTITANSHTTVNVDISKTGYTPIGIIGVTWSGNSWPVLGGFYMTSSTNAALYVINPTSSAMSITKYFVSVLYLRN